MQSLKAWHPVTGNAGTHNIIHACGHKPCQVQMLLTSMLQSPELGDKYQHQSMSGHKSMDVLCLQRVYAISQKRQSCQLCDQNHLQNVMLMAAAIQALVRHMYYAYSQSAQYARTKTKQALKARQNSVTLTFGQLGFLSWFLKQQTTISSEGA